LFSYVFNIFLEVDVAQPVAHCSFNPGIDCTALTSTSSCITQAALNTAVVPNIGTFYHCISVVS